MNPLKTHIFRLLAALLEGLLRSRGTFRGGVDLGLFRMSNRPSGRRGGTLDLSESPTDPLGGGDWTLDSLKERIQVQQGVGGVQSDARIQVSGCYVTAYFTDWRL